MLIAISGSQGTGKTTILTELKDRGFRVIERKTARSILDEWATTLDVVNDNITLKIAFQEELIRRKYYDELDATLSSDIVFTERTFADPFVYSLISFGQFNKYDKWIESYFNKCKIYCDSYSHVFYINSKFSSNIESDGVRSTNQHYSRMVDSVMADITNQMVDADTITVIDTPILAERIDIILDQVTSLNKE